MVANFEALARQRAPSVGGLPVMLLLRNSRLETKKVIAVGWIKWWLARR